MELVDRRAQRLTGDVDVHARADQFPAPSAWPATTTSPRAWAGPGIVFGNGKTALKVNFGKYLQNATNDENYTANNPAARIVRSVLNRGWTDNGNRVVDCDLRSPALQDNRASGGDLCAALGGNDLNFGSANPNSTIINPDILEGWGVRPYDGQVGVSVQHEVMPRLSVEASYNRRWFGNFFVTDNLAVGPADYDPWVYTAPLDSRLPDGGGYPLTVYSLTAAAAARAARNHQTFETDFGDARTQVLARSERLGERTAPQRLHVPGRDEHRPRRA